MLVQAPGEHYLLQPFDGDYVAGECSGLDDMFPTIDAFYYDRFPWQGIKMADHGEVWSLPWSNVAEADRLHLIVHGVRFPYRLEKQVSFADDTVLTVHYHLTNLSPFDLDFVWAAHAMINIEEDTELVLPEAVTSVIGTFSMTGDLGYGDELAWPLATLPDGSRRDLRRLAPRTARQAYKYYVKHSLPEGWCGLKYRRSGFSLALSFPKDRVPYLGILPNEGGWRDYYMVFLEPCTAPFDRPDAARYRGQGATVRGNSSYDWHLNITLAEGTEFQRAAEDGRLLTKEGHSER
jgi:hypothetical protein